MVTKGYIVESVQGIVERVTFHSETTGWSVLRVNSYAEQDIVTVTVHQTKVFAGATMHFHGSWTTHPKFGRQFKADRAEEKKPATCAALEKYLGSGLIKGVGPKTAKKIVSYFGDKTLNVFESQIDDLLKIPGIAAKKLEMITLAWEEHKAIRDVMIFLQGHGLSTLFAVRIYKEYGDKAIAFVQENPYRLADDFYGIGFFSADKVALSLGIPEDSEIRIIAAIRHILSASREQGHCYLTFPQILSDINQLLDLNLVNSLEAYLLLMQQQNRLKTRNLILKDPQAVTCYYSQTLYFDEKKVAESLYRLTVTIKSDHNRIGSWLQRYGDTQNYQLSEEQSRAVTGIASCSCSILTGGPGCGKTTTTRTLVKLLQAMQLQVTLAAPTGRAAQRMTEVIGLEAKTIHRLLEYQGGKFQRNIDKPLATDCLVVDECSMLDISLSASLLEAIPTGARVVFIGDPDQLPSVGAGNVLADMIHSGKIPCFHLTTVFRQASESLIVNYAHAINKGKFPHIESPFKTPQVWLDKKDCLFIDSGEATKEQLRIISRVKTNLMLTDEEREKEFGNDNLFVPQSLSDILPDASTALIEKYNHINFGMLQTAENKAEELRAVARKVHPWSSLYYGMTALDTIIQLYTNWIPKYFGKNCEIQILSPMTRASLGTNNLNNKIQQAVNPQTRDKASLTLGQRIFRTGDRVIHRRNNYDLGVYNGDIGRITNINSLDLTCHVHFFAGNRIVEYQKEQISELELAYAITIHKSQGSEFDCVIVPIVNQHFKMLYRNLIYTGLTRARKLAVFVGTRQALAMAIRNKDSSSRQTALAQLINPTLRDHSKIT